MRHLMREQIAVNNADFNKGTLAGTKIIGPVPVDALEEGFHCRRLCAGPETASEGEFGRVVRAGLRRIAFSTVGAYDQEIYEGVDSHTPSAHRTARGDGPPSYQYAEGLQRSSVDSD